MSESDIIDFRDIQGLVRFGHGRLPAACMLLLGIKDAGTAKHWLANADITSAEKVSPLPARALQVAFTAPGLTALAIDPTVLAQFSDEFLAGMTGASRSRRLGDAGANAPANWQWGGSDTGIPHVLLMLYARAGELEAWHHELCDAGFYRAFELQRHFTTNNAVTTEPFGFADGISQPGIDWERLQTSNLHRRDRYSNLLSLGEILLGYPNEYGEYTQRPLVAVTGGDPGLPLAEDQPDMRDLGRNGTYLVFRQLAQDVRGFWQFLDQSSGYDDQQREQLAAAMVGRHRDGTPLVEPERGLIEGIDPAQFASNNFTYDNDQVGHTCPVAAHVRRSNPRTGDYPPGVRGMLTRLIRILGFGKDSRALDLVASARFHRILRRGRQYGPVLSAEQALRPPAQSNQPEEERGLHFICLSANIARQFEFVQNAWADSGKFAGLQDEEDPLLGNREPLFGGTRTDQFSRPAESGIRRCTPNLPRFVTVRGGAYFFMPGLCALRYITTGNGKATARNGKAPAGNTKTPAGEERP